ncbi:hypothetical protein ACVWXM_007529 [Bradyrhizobium sp. GM7.3]
MRTTILPSAPTRLHRPERFPEIIQREDATDHRLQLALDQPGRQLRHQALLHLGLADWKLREVDAEQGAALQQWQVEWQCRDRAGGKTDHEMTAAPGDGAKGLYRDFAADGVEDHVCAAS